MHLSSNFKIWLSENVSTNLHLAAGVNANVIKVTGVIRPQIQNKHVINQLGVNINTLP